MVALPKFTLLRFTVIFACTAVLAPALRAELRLEPASIDFGRARQEKKLQAKVKLTNDGKKPLTILRVATSCNCTAATPQRNELPPGESTEMEVSFETRSYQGEVKRTVMVETSEGDVSLPVTATVSQYDDWMPSAAIVVLAPSNKGEESKGGLTVAFTGDGEAKVVGGTADVPWLKVQVEDAGARASRITVTKLANAPAGSHQPNVTLKTNDAHEPQIVLPVFAQVYSTLSLNPNPLLLPTVKVGATATLPASLYNWEAKEDPRFELEGGEATLSQRDRRDALLLIKVTPTKLGTTTRLLRIYAGQNLEAEIPVIIRAEE